MKKLGLIAFLMICLYAPTRADQLTLSFFQGSTDNLFQTAYPERDQVSSLSFSFVSYGDIRA